MQKLTYFLFIIPLLLLSFIVSGQNYLFHVKHLTTEQGLSNLLNTAITIDQQGFLWGANQYGLYRYDGYNFKTYSDKEYNIPQVPIQDIKEDENGNLWLFHSRTKATIVPHIKFNPANRFITIFNPRTEQVIPFDTYVANSSAITSKYILTKVIDTKKRIWLSTTEGELFLFQKDKTLKKVFEKKGVYFQLVTVDQEDNIWIGWAQTVVKINPDGKILRSIELSEQVVGIWTATNGRVWIATGTWQYDNTNSFDSFTPKLWTLSKSDILTPFLLYKEEKELKIPPLKSMLIHRSKKGYWYVSIDNQMYLFDQNGSFLCNYNEFLRGKTSMQFTNYWEDNTKLWFTTPVGIIETKVAENPFKLIYKSGTYSDSRGITEDDQGNIYIRVRDLFRYHPKQDSLVPIKDIKGSFELACQDSFLLISSYAKGVKVGFLQNIKNKKLYSISDSSKIVNSDFYTTLQLKHTPKQTLLGLENGLCIVDVQQKTILPFTKYNTFEQLQFSTVNYLHRSQNGIWIATNTGLFFMTEKEGIVAHYNKENKTLPYDKIRHIYEDKEGIFWLATRGGGIIKWQPNGVFEQFTTKEGLAHDFTYAIYEDDYNRLWITSDRGLMAFDKVNNEIKTYLTSDGLPHNEFNFISHHQTKDGTLYFGGLGGIISFHPKQFPARQFKHTTPLHFVEIAVLEEGKKTITDKTDLLKSEDPTVILQPSDKFLEFQFSLLDYDAPEKHQYAYQVEGFSNNWTTIKENTIRIAYLPYGRYTLRIRGKNNLGWSKNELAIAIIRKYPFYLRWWFILSMITGIILLIKLLVDKREKRLISQKELLQEKIEEGTLQLKKDKLIIEAQKEELKKIDTLKSRFFANVTHELKTPLTLISAPLKDVLTKEELSDQLKITLDGIHQNAQKLITLIEELVDLSKMDYQQLTLQETKIMLYPFVKRLIAAHQSYALYRRIDLQFNYKADRYLTVLLDIKKFEKIVNNLLSNALKFTSENGHIILSIEDLGRELKLTVKDTGKGIPDEDLPYIFDRFFQSKTFNKATEGGTGIGLTLCMEYVKLFKGKLEVESKLGKGSCFLFSLPKKEIFSDFTADTPKTLHLQKKETNKSNPSKVGDQKVLIVEDNKEMADYLSAVIGEHYTVYTADNGQAALNQLADFTPDLVISDVMMPEMDGFQLLQTVKKQPKNQFLPFIMLTAKSDLVDKIHALSLGVDDYLTKPFQSEELLARTTNIINNQAARKQLLETIKKGSSFTFAPVSSQQKIWLEELEEIVKNNIADSQFNVGRLATILHISERTLRTKIKSTTGLSPLEYIKEARLTKARHLLERGRYKTVAEVAYAIGMKHPTNFTKLYKKRFGKVPSEYL